VEDSRYSPAAAGETLIDGHEHLHQNRDVKIIITALQVSVLAFGLVFAFTGCSKDEPSPPPESEQPPNPDNPDIPPEPGQK
jgi:hypothetical protein